MAIAAALLAILAVVMVVGLATVVRTHDAVIREGTTNRQARIATYNLIQASVDAETGQRGYLLTDDRSYLEPYARGRTAMIDNIAVLKQTLGDTPSFSSVIAHSEHLSLEAFTAMDATLTQHRRSHSSQEFLDSLNRSKAAMDALRAELGELLQAVEEKIDDTRSAERRASNTLYWLGGVMASLCLLAVLLTVLALRSERRNWHTAFNALSEAKAAAEEAREQATAADLAKTRFLAVASHDMRQPLHALTLYLSALERRVDAPETRDIIEKMERATNSMVSMFATLLDLARIQAGVITPEIEDFPLQDVFDRIVAENPGGAVKTAPTSILLRSDPVLIERMLRNLVSNALKHGGGQARVSAAIAGASANVTVADNGPGIPEQDQQRIFDEFVRLDGRGEGLGLGLAIVARIADILGTPLSVFSSPGRGARFTIKAALAEAVTETTPRQAAPNVHLSGARVLVIDDDALAREAVTGVLRDLGAVVRAGANESEGEAALADGFKPRLLVMDLRIDGQLAGIEIGKRLRARIEPRPSVIVITGDTGPETLSLLRNSGFAWLIKPVSTQTLSEAVAEQIAEA